MSQANLPYRALLLSCAALCGLSVVSQTAIGQSVNAGGFGNIGMGSLQGFGSLGGNTGASTGLGGLGGQGSSSAAGGLGGMSGLGGMPGIGGMGGLGGSGGIGSSFDPSFGATQMASSLATAAAVSRVTSSLGARSGFGGGFGSGRGGFGGNNNNQNAQSKGKVRAVLRIGFPAEGRTASATAQMVTDRLSKMPLPAGLANVRIAMQGRTAVLLGEIESVEDGKLIEHLLSLEPGIDSVKNELVLVGAAEEVPTPLPTE